MNILQHIGKALLATLLEMAPYLLFGFLFAGLLAIWISPQWVERHLGRGRVLPVIKAALLGIPLPLCSCGVIPVAASLRSHGANRGATTAFLIATPQTGVDSILVTYSLLGPLFALFRPVAAFISGVVGGLAVGRLNEPAVAAPALPAPVGRRSLARGLRHGFVTLPRDIATPLVIGLIVAGLISAMVPPDYFAGSIGSGLSGKVIMMLVGIPMYVCATASVPVAAALISSGISPGAALIFLMTGPATNAAAIVTIWKTMGGRATAIYLAAVAVTALASGMLLDGLYTVTAARLHAHDHAMLPVWIQWLSVVLLLSVLANAKWGKLK